MKKYLFLSALGLSIGAKCIASPFLAVGDGAELFVTGSLGVRADDNIFLNIKDEDDIVIEFAPGAELTFGKGAQIQGRLTIVDAFTTYMDNDGLGSNLFSTNFNANYDDGKFKADAALGYNELNQNTVDIRGLTRRNVFTAAVNAEAQFSPLTALASGVAFSREDYRRTGYGDSESLTVPVTVYYKSTPKTDLSLGYRYRDYQTAIGSDSGDHFLNLGARGEFTPKLSGSFSVGLNRRNASGADQSDLGIDAKFNYEFTAKTTIRVGISRDYSTSPQGAQQQNLTLNAQGTTQINTRFSVNTGLVYRMIEYSTRTDDYFEALLGGSYSYNSMISLNANYTFRTYFSDLRSGEFTNHVFAISAAFRY